MRNAAFWAEGAIGALLVIIPWIMGSGQTLLGWTVGVLGIILVIVNAWLIFDRDPLDPRP